MKIEQGSKWSSADGRLFIVNKVEDLEGRLWIRYSEYGSDREYSCYSESFVSRFYPIINQ